MEFIKVISDYNYLEEEIDIHLITNGDPEFIPNTVQAFGEITMSINPNNIHFTYAFDANLHDRSITLDNGWKILLGRGLDIYKRVEGHYNMEEICPELRKCKECEITIINTIQEDQKYDNTNIPEKNYKPLSDLEVQRKKNKSTPKSPRTNLVVEFNNGTIINYKKAADTLIETIKKIGIERVRELNINVRGYNLVGKEKSHKYMQHYVNGYYICTHSSTKEKKEQLQKISQKLSLQLKITTK